MYMAYGWPQVIPLELPNFPSTQQILYLKIVNRLLLVVSPTHLELWSSSQHRVRLGKYKRDADSIQREGENLHAVWSPDMKLIAILTSSFYLHIFKVQITEKKIHVGGKQPTGLCLINISLLLCEQVPFANKNLTVSNIICDNKHMLIGLSDGSLYNISWKGEFCGAFYLDVWLNDNVAGNKLSYHLGNGLASGEIQGVHESNRMNHVVMKKYAVVHLEYSMALRLLFVLFSDGELMLCSVNKKGLKHTESIRVEKRLSSSDVVCASVAPEQQILAVGTRKGAVELYNLADSASLIRSVSLYDWGLELNFPRGHMAVSAEKYLGLETGTIACELKDSQMVLEVGGCIRSSSKTKLVIDDINVADDVGTSQYVELLIWGTCILKNLCRILKNNENLLVKMSD